MKALIYFTFLLLCLNTAHQGVFCQEKTKLTGSLWSEILENGEGEIVFYWYETIPNIYREGDTLQGIEYEIAQRFKQFLEEEYEVTLRERWVNAAEFEHLIQDVSISTGGVFGMSGISVSDERKKIIQFTPPHMPDICVLVSSPNVPVEYTVTGFLNAIEEITAVTVKGSVFEDKLLEIQRDNEISIAISYIDRVPELMQKLEGMTDGFGYVDLPSYLLNLDQGTSVRRQFFYPLKLPGLSFVYPKNSDWEAPVAAYYTSPQFQTDRDLIISKYLGEEIIDLMERISRTAEMGPEDEIIILNKERELQYQELLDQNVKMQKNQRLITLLAIIIIIVLLVATIFYTRYRVKTIANRELAAKQAEIELKNARLVELNTEKDGLIGVLAHDLKAPISRMKGIMQLIMTDRSEDLSKMYSMMLKEVENTSALITKILDVEAIESKRLNLKKEAINPTSIINELIADYEHIATKKQIKIETKPNPENVTITADKVYLRQVLENLLSNAIKFSNEGTSVFIEIDSDGIIHIKDEGPGFTKADKQKVFRKFQVLSAKPTGGEQSTGLGLITVKMLMELMNGELSFDSKEGIGTTFYIKLPQVTV